MVEALSFGLAVNFTTRVKPLIMANVKFAKVVVAIEEELWLSGSASVSQTEGPWIDSCPSHFLSALGKVFHSSHF